MEVKRAHIPSVVIITAAETTAEFSTAFSKSTKIRFVMKGMMYIIHVSRPIYRDTRKIIFRSIFNCSLYFCRNLITRINTLYFPTYIL